MRDSLRTIVLNLLAAFFLSSIAFAAELHFNETFEDNRRKWRIGKTGETTVSIERGLLRVSNDEREVVRFHSTGMKIDYDGTRNLDTSIQTRYRRGALDGFFGVMLHSTVDESEYVRIMMNEMGEVFADGKLNDRYLSHLRQTRLDAYRSGVLNTIRFRKVGNDGFIFLNDVVIAILSLGDLKGMQFRPILQSEMIADYDNLRIQYLDDREGEKDVPRLFAEYNAFKKNLAVVAEPLVETFEDNRKGWLPVAAARHWTGKIDEGRFLVETRFPKAERSLIRFAKGNLDTTRDYEMSVRLRYLQGADNKFIGLVWGVPDQGGGRTVFGLSGNRAYVVRYHNTMRWGDVIPWTKSDLLHETDWNTLMARKVGSKMFYYVNETLIGESGVPRWFGPWLGLDVGNGVLAEFDSLEIRYIDQPQDVREYMGKKFEEDWREQQIANGPELIPVLETFENNERDWLYIESGSDWTALISEGGLVWENRNRGKGTQGTSARIPINTHADFELTLDLELVEGSQRREYGFEWGRGESFAFKFAISGDGHFFFSKAGDRSQRIPWTKSDFIKTSGTNRLTARKIENTYYLLINGGIVAERKSGLFTGERVYLLTGGEMKVRFERFELKYPKLSEVDSNTEKSGYEKMLEESEVIFRRSGVVAK